MPTVQLHQREHRSLLAGVERRALVWLAVRLPAGVSADHLTLLGLVSMIAAGAAFAAVRVTPWAALGVVAALAANWFGDSLDGTVARVRDQQRPRYGFYVDHAIDLAGTSCLLAGLACSGRMSPLVAVSLLSAYLLVSAEAYLATHAAGVFRISVAGIGPTELRIILAIGAVEMVAHPVVAVAGMPPQQLFDIGGVIAIAGLAVTFVGSAVRNTRRLYLVEPLQPRRASAA
jgi:phosphatidylglycerophosphate synthase